MKKKLNQGQILIQILIFTTIALFFICGIINWFTATLAAAKLALLREQAFHIAEAGIEYYRWHLAHAPQDFQDGTGEPGPYIHDFKDKNGDTIGQFILNITPPAIGSTLVTIESEGKTSVNPNVSRTIVVKLAKPSFAKYAVAANDNMRFGEGTEVFGEIHSNKGIRFDGVAHNVVSSALTQYQDPDHGGCQEYAVHTHIYPQDPCPPTPLPTRNDIFKAGRQIGMPQIDFPGITAELADLKRVALYEGGFYRASSGKYGYHIVLKTDGNFDLYAVTQLVNPPSFCTNYLNQPRWGTWSIQKQQKIGTFSFPSNGIIFLEDDIFIDGQINNARLTIAAASFPESDDPLQWKHITINNDLLYTNYDGRDVIGLIAQGNINVGLKSEDDLRIDAALIAQKGNVGRYYYRSYCGTEYRRQKIVSYGMIASNQRYGFAYTDGTGYQMRNLIYDANLLYSPPPNFPLAADQYITLSWQEIIK